MSAHDDKKLMQRALELAEKGQMSCDPNPCVGCVIAWNGEIMGEGWHAKAGGPHAEIVALDAAGASARDAAVYLTLEPCCHHGRTPPCVDALIKARVARVVIAMQDPHPKVSGGGFKALKSAGISVECGLLKKEARALNRGFVQRCETGRPRVVLKIAASLDGRTAMASGESQWITGDASRADVHLLRAQCSAIVTGSGTMIADDPALTARRPDGELYERQPMRVIVDSELKTPPTAQCFQLPGKTVVATATEDGPRWQPYIEHGAELMYLPDDGKVDLKALIAELGELQCNTVMIEAGSVLSGAFMQQELVDAITVYVAPMFLGSDGRGMLDISDIRTLSDRVDLEVTGLSRIGDDIRIEADLAGKRRH